MNSSMTRLVILSMITCCSIHLHAADPVPVGTLKPSVSDLPVFGQSVDVPAGFVSEVADHTGIALKSTMGLKSLEAGFSGSWYNASQSGHGFIIEVLDNGVVLMYWFVYDGFGNPIFLVGTGSMTSANTASLDMLYVSNMSFGSFSPTFVTREFWGTVVITFSSCNAATVQYNSGFVDRNGSFYGSGTIPITRLTSISGLDCMFTPAGGTTTLTIKNELLNDALIRVNGQQIGVSSAGQTQAETVNFTGALTVSWELIRSETTNGTPIGDSISGTFNLGSSPGSQVNLTIDNTFSDGSAIFIPVITNSTSLDGLIGVNMGLTSENRCNCIAPAGRTVQVGYYHLFSNSNVRAYRSGSNYTGSYSFWGSNPGGTAPPGTPITSLVANGSGRTNLNLSSLSVSGVEVAQ